MQLIDGKATATAIKAEIAEEVKAIVAAGGKQPHLAAVLVGHDGGSETYVKNKVLACEACGFKSTLIRYEDDVTEEELLLWKRSAPSAEEINRAVTTISEVRSHPQGLAQCQKFLMRCLPNARQRESWDTAGAARDLAQEMTPNVAVIAPAGAVRYGMTILKENIEDASGNTTRFLFLRKTPLKSEEIHAHPITTLVFRTRHIAGALVEALKVFQAHNINMTKLETYMTGIHHSEPVFYVDLAMNQYDDAGMKTLEELRKASLSVQVLGTYEASPARSERFGFAAVD